MFITQDFQKMLCPSCAGYQEAPRTAGPVQKQVQTHREGVEKPRTMSAANESMGAEDLIQAVLDGVPILEAVFQAGVQGTVAFGLRKSVGSRKPGQGGLPIFGPHVHAYKRPTARIHRQLVKARRVRRPIPKAGRTMRARLYAKY